LRGCRVEGAGGVGFEIAIGVALNDRKPVANARVDPRLAELHAPAVNILVPHEMGEQRPVATADVQHAGARVDHFRDEP
jgi:hypothetical protein